MSEEKKTVELKDEELVKIAGGFEPASYKINVGDTFLFSNATKPHYFVFEGPSGEYYPNVELNFLECYVFAGSKKKLSGKYTINQVLNWGPYIGNRTMEEIDALLNQ